MYTALIVDDEPDIRELLEMTLNRMGIDTHSAGNINEAHELLRNYQFDVCLTDMRLPDGNGIDLVEYIQKLKRPLPTAVITAHGNMEAAIRALKAGAFDFISKPVDLKSLRDLVDHAVRVDKTVADPVASETLSGDATGSETQLVGNSAVMKSLKATMNKLSRSQAPVWIRGESGTGKELVAKIIHELGPRKDAPFVPVNCGAIPSELMESEFFGHQRGSFTGATSDKVGLFQSAEGGTLFLDEVADLPLAMQVKLLRAIQEKAVRPIGSNSEILLNVRILSASHKNLAREVEASRFRQDLYYRLNVIELAVPSLRERADDIPQLVSTLLARMSQPEQAPTVASDALNALCEYEYPGNVRELENILERAMALCENNVIASTDLGLRKSPAPVAADAQAEGTSSSSLTSMASLVERERNALIEALEKTRWNKKAAAKLLGITYRQLRYKVEKLDL
ncbi:MAG: sigma-54 dependent transcriptional regulator [Pseudomonadota bacterium]